MRVTIVQDLNEWHDDESGDYETESDIWDCKDLRAAIQALFQTRTNHVGDVVSIEASSSIVDSNTWITVYNDAEFITGIKEQRSLFIEGITNSSKSRLFKLIIGG